MIASIFNSDPEANNNDFVIQQSQLNGCCNVFLRFRSDYSNIRKRPCWAMYPILLEVILFSVALN